MKVVIDTNCLLSCIGKKSPYRNVFDFFLARKIIICASTEILLEYEEAFSRFWGNDVTKNLMGLFETRENFEHVLVYYNWHLISKDEDDNKFTYCYIAANAEYLITNDKGFNKLKSLAFPSLNVVSIQEFEKIVQL